VLTTQVRTGPGTQELPCPRFRLPPLLPLPPCHIPGFSCLMVLAYVTFLVQPLICLRLFPSSLRPSTSVFPVSLTASSALSPSPPSSGVNLLVCTWRAALVVEKCEKCCHHPHPHVGKGENCLEGDESLRGYLPLAGCCQRTSRYASRARLPYTGLRVAPTTQGRASPRQRGRGPWGRKGLGRKGRGRIRGDCTALLEPVGP